mmetsp:Transcript_106653/g.309276  ORF Transcript_106653/g.309276 Transcript_106653/m.309276 type:complete len:89 (-) Transcript_106653:33-299(-)
MPVEVGIFDEPSSIGEFNERLLPVDYLDYLARIQLAHKASFGPVQNSCTVELKGEPTAEDSLDWRWFSQGPRGHGSGGSGYLAGHLTA